MFYVNDSVEVECSWMCGKRSTFDSVKLVRAIVEELFVNMFIVCASRLQFRVHNSRALSFSMQK